MRAGFALDLRGRPRIVGRDAVARSAADWLELPPALRRARSRAGARRSRSRRGFLPGLSRAITTRFSCSRHAGACVTGSRCGCGWESSWSYGRRGRSVRRLELRGLRVSSRRHHRVLELGIANRGNVTESLARAGSTLSLFRGGRRIAKLHAEPREVRPQTRGRPPVRLPRHRSWIGERARVDVAAGELRAASSGARSGFACRRATSAARATLTPRSRRSPSSRP